jgi:hypothetical protein
VQRQGSRESPFSADMVIEHRKHTWKAEDGDYNVEWVLSPYELIMPGLAGHLAVGYSITTGLATFMSTATLSPGSWLVTMDAFVGTGLAGTNVEITAVPGTATATFDGIYSANVAGSASILFATASLSFIATVTVGGTINFQAIATSTSGGPSIGNTTATHAYTNATGWTAIQL